MCVCVGGGRHMKVTNKIKQEMTKGDINLRTNRNTGKTVNVQLIQRMMPF